MKHLDWKPIDNGLFAGNGCTVDIILTNDQFDTSWHYTIYTATDGHTLLASAAGSAPSLGESLVAIDQYLSTTYVYRTL